MFFFVTNYDKVMPMNNMKYTNDKKKNYYCIDNTDSHNDEFEKKYFYQNDNIEYKKLQYYRINDNNKIERINMTKEYLKRSSTFYNENHMGPIYIDTKPNMLFISNSIEYEECHEEEKKYKIYQENKIFEEKKFIKNTTKNIDKKNFNDDIKINIKKDFNSMKYNFSNFGSTDTLNSHSNQSGCSNEQIDDTKCNNDKEKKNILNDYSVTGDTNECTVFGYSECVHLPCQSFQSVSRDTDNRAKHQEHNRSIEKNKIISLNVNEIKNNDEDIPKSLAIIKSINSQSLLNLTESISIDNNKDILSDFSDDLRSPKLVNNFTNSLIDINASENSEVRRSQYADNLNDDSYRKLTTGNGITLPLFYGPTPYSWYLRKLFFIREKKLLTNAIFIFYY